jgi:alpha-L-arabinofuranosidase
VRREFGHSDRIKRISQMGKKRTTICVDCRKKVGEINPLLYGGGFENVGGAVHLGLEAQLLDGENFQEDDVNQDGISDKWSPAGYGNNVVRYSRDGRQALSGFFSQKIEIFRYHDGESGIRQGGLFITRGKKYIASLYLRQKGFERGTSVWVSLRKGGKILAQQKVSRISSDWGKYILALTPNESSLDGEFWITLKGKGILWIDRVFLVPRDSYLGHATRKDIIEAIVSLGPAFIRWPGGWFSENYHWQDGVGSPDRRPLRIKYYSSIRAKNDPSWESNRFGTDEFIQFCRDVGAIPVLTVNIGYEKGGNTDELIDEGCSWVEYCNGKSTTPYGALRKANGFPEPFGVKYWGIGNEPWEMDPREYARLLVRFAKGMKAKDPTIKLIGAGAHGYNSSWNERVLQFAGPYIDYLDLHYYYSGNYLEAMAEPLKYEKFLKSLKRKISTLVPNKEVKLAILEWNSNTNLKDAGRLKEGLFAAGFLNALERQNDLVNLSSPWPLLRRVPTYSNHLSEHGLIRFDNHRVFLSPTGLAFKLYRHHSGPERLRCQLKCPTFIGGKRYEFSLLDVVATANSRKGRIFLKVLNRSADKDIQTEIIFEGLKRGRIPVTVATLNASDVESENSLAHPNKVTISSQKISWDPEHFEYSFPAHSVTAIKLETSLPIG